MLYFHNEHDMKVKHQHINNSKGNFVHVRDMDIFWKEIISSNTIFST